MDNDDFESKAVVAKDVDTDVDNADDEQGNVWEGIANSAYKGGVMPEDWSRPASQGDRCTIPNDLFYPQSEAQKKEALLTKTARELAKAAAFDGTLTDEEKSKLKEAFQSARDLGCDKELVKAINDQLKKAGSKHRVFLDTRDQDDDSKTPVRRAYFSDRQITVVNTDTGEVTDSHKFSVLNSEMLRPPIEHPFPRPRPPIDDLFPRPKERVPVDPEQCPVPGWPRLEPGWRLVPLPAPVRPLHEVPDLVPNQIPDILRKLSR